MPTPPARNICNNLRAGEVRLCRRRPHPAEKDPPPPAKG
ncbi:hypothetical protein ATSB10_38270 [Dyella thiooxydans]|uniref:Uncharacterized protein n=1 Tax=Dyella thiooxydans TaxID=445710 RepID=A0A160N579_9GAMM|nr:hypothetical protein ATSB10_38270 [Dyella thiooxydans]